MITVSDMNVQIGNVNAFYVLPLLQQGIFTFRVFLFLHFASLFLFLSNSSRESNEK